MTTKKKVARRGKRPVIPCITKFLPFVQTTLKRFLTWKERNDRAWDFASFSLLSRDHVPCSPKEEGGEGDERKKRNQESGSNRLTGEAIA
jgi:hypothetical protein